MTHKCRKKFRFHVYLVFDPKKINFFLAVKFLNSGHQTLDPDRETLVLATQ
jgi:hypothetical protein